MVRLALCGSLAALLMLGSGATAQAKDAACWSIVYRTIEHNAAAPQYRYISYSENERIQKDGLRYEYADASITYRNDGLAYVDDNRWQHPFMSAWLEPGPPVLGPYGSARRSTWLAFAAPVRGVNVIANASTSERTRCIVAGTDTIDGERFAHIVFPDVRGTGVKAVWIDPLTLDVKRVITSEWVTFVTEDRRIVHDLTDYTVNLEQRSGIEVVHDITWQDSYRIYDQRSTLRARYTFHGYAFNQKPPLGTAFAKSR